MVQHKLGYKDRLPHLSHHQRKDIKSQPHLLVSTPFLLHSPLMEHLPKLVKNNMEGHHGDHDHDHDHHDGHGDGDDDESHDETLMPGLPNHHDHHDGHGDGDGDGDGDDDESHDETLMPGLPNHLAHLCLAPLPPLLLFSVCRAWRRLLYSSSFPPFFSLYALLSPTKNHHQSVEFFSLDPLTSTWQSLPSPPNNPPLRLLHRHPSFLSRNLPIQSLTVSNHFVLMAGTCPEFAPALSTPLVFHPESNHWFFGPPFSIPRRWCATGCVRGVVYMASGVASHYRGDVARSMEQWDMKEKVWRWEKMAGLKDGRFSREAIEAVGYKGKLCMVNVKGNAVKEGLVYDAEANSWKDMPVGMLAGWNGPAATMNEEALYVVDEGNGSLNEYDCEKDCWRKVIELAELKDAEHVAAGRGRVCAVCANGERIVVVDVVAAPVRFWVVEPPWGHQVVAVHILPRMSRQRSN